jgi:hypothetical protein
MDDADRPSPKGRALAATVERVGSHRRGRIPSRSLDRLLDSRVNQPRGSVLLSSYR